MKLNLNLFSDGFWNKLRIAKFVLDDKFKKTLRGEWEGGIREGGEELKQLMSGCHQEESCNNDHTVYCGSMARQRDRGNLILQSLVDKYININIIQI